MRAAWSWRKAEFIQPHSPNGDTAYTVYVDLPLDGKGQVQEPPSEFGAVSKLGAHCRCEQVAQGHKLRLQTCHVQCFLFSISCLFLFFCGA
jgi:hypothetical protein